MKFPNKFHPNHCFPGKLQFYITFPHIISQNFAKSKFLLSRKTKKVLFSYVPNVFPSTHFSISIILLHRKTKKIDFLINFSTFQNFGSCLIGLLHPTYRLQIIWNGFYRPRFFNNEKKYMTSNFLPFGERSSKRKAPKIREKASKKSTRLYSALNHSCCWIYRGKS